MNEDCRGGREPGCRFSAHSCLSPSICDVQGTETHSKPPAQLGFQESPPSLLLFRPPRRHMHKAIKSPECILDRRYGLLASGQKCCRVKSIGEHSQG